MVRRPFNFLNDYDIVGQWWEKHGSLIPQSRYLPKDGIVIEIDGEMAAAGFMYRTDSVICIFEWFVVNPDLEKEDRDKALDYLVESAIEWKDVNNYEVIYTSTNVGKFIKRLQGNGFLKVEDGNSHLFYGVDNE